MACMVCLELTRCHVRADYTSALDKITDSTADSGASNAESKGVTATAAEYISSGAQAVAQKAKEVRSCVTPSPILMPNL